MSSENKNSPQDVRFSEELAELLRGLEGGHKFRKWIGDMVDLLWEDMTVGESIQKERIPRYYRRTYNVNNLYRFEHPEGYRSIYTLAKFNELGVCPFILEILSHPEYDGRFGYR